MPGSDVGNPLGNVVGNPEGTGGMPLGSVVGICQAGTVVPGAGEPPSPAAAGFAGWVPGRPGVAGCTGTGWPPGPTMGARGAAPGAPGAPGAAGVPGTAGCADAAGSVLSPDSSSFFRNLQEAENDNAMETSATRVTIRAKGDELMARERSATWAGARPMGCGAGRRREKKADSR